MIAVVFYGLSFLVAGAILVAHLLLAGGIVRNRLRDHRLFPGLTGRDVREGMGAGDAGGGKRVSVIVVSRNEEAVLAELLESIERQEASDLEVVLVDDRSSDGTGRIMEDYRHRSRHQVTVLRNRREPEGVTGKVQGLELAVHAAHGELLLFTDSDCLLPPDWVRAHVGYYDDPHVGAVFGQVGMRRRRRFLDSFQAFDQHLIHQYSCGSAGLGIANGCFGNNLSVRREALSGVGGFVSLGYTVTEDAALISAIAAKTGFRVLASSLESMRITTRPQPSWRAFINQHVRWNMGAYYSRDRATAWGYRFVVLYLIYSILAIPLVFLFPGAPLLALNSLVSIGMLGLVSGFVYRDMGRWWFVSLFPYTLVFMFFYSLVTALAIVRRPTTWKGARLRPEG